jgi:hypothetical protein
MSKFKIKKLPSIRLADLLRKRKTNLKKFLSSSGIVAYVTLIQKCEKMGVSPPTEEEFKAAVGPVASSPQEGVVVLDPPSLVKDSTGEKIAVDSFLQDSSLKKKEETEIQETSLKKSEKKVTPTKKHVIDESVFITKIPEESLEKSAVDLGDASVVEDDLNSSISKLLNLKKQNESS